jgi:hypothetical protein
MGMAGMLRFSVKEGVPPSSAKDIAGGYAGGTVSLC